MERTFKTLGFTFAGAIQTVDGVQRVQRDFNTVTDAEAFAASRAIGFYKINRFGMYV